MVVTWWRAALLGRCPACGEGALFDGLTGLRSACPVCGDRFDDADVGDGATVFVVLVAGALVVPLVPLLLLALHWPPLVVLPLLLGLLVGVCLGLLRVFKAGLFVLQRRFRAGEGRLDRP